MPIYQLDKAFVFPKPELAEPNGLLAVGGDLHHERLILAYENGIFPWYNADQPILWWSPEKRMILPTGNMKVSKSLLKSVSKGGFELRIDSAFDEVIKTCGKVPRKDQDGTWITDQMLHAYNGLHGSGFAHSFEVWQDDKLVGGLYGLSLGRVFFGESMFSSVTDASKVAFFHLHEFALHNDFHFIDCQLHTDHLASLGAAEIDRAQYLRELKAALAFPDLVGKWTTTP